MKFYIYTDLKDKITINSIYNNALLLEDGSELPFGMVKKVFYVKNKKERHLSLLNYLRELNLCDSSIEWKSSKNITYFALDILIAFYFFGYHYVGLSIGWPDGLLYIIFPILIAITSDIVLLQNKGYRLLAMSFILFVSVFVYWLI